MWFYSLPPSERAILVLIKAYEDTRREVQWGYKVFQEEGIQNVDTPLWKTFRTVLKFLQDHGWDITWKEVHWIGYVKFSFEVLKPTIPSPGQLKNKKVLADYMLSVPKSSGPVLRTFDELEKLYEKILHPQISSDPQLMKVLGVKRI